MKKFKVALSAGHTPNSPGATQGDVSEYGLSSAVLGDLIFRLDKEGHEAWIVGADTNKSQVKAINKLNADFGLELHFNNMTTKPEWNGSLVMHAGSSNGKHLASCINLTVATILQTKDRGIYKAHYQLDKRRPLITIVKKTNCPFVLVEPLYLSNPSDFAKIDITLISVGILRGLEAYWGGAA